MEQQRPTKEPNRRRQDNPSHANHVKSGENDFRIKATALDSIDGLLDALAKEMDSDFMEIGKSVSELFRAVCAAAAKLPSMKLSTDLITITRDDDGLMVRFLDKTLNAEYANKERRVSHTHHEEGYDPFDDFDSDDEEEGLLYDGD